VAEFAESVVPAAVTTPARSMLAKAVFSLLLPPRKLDQTSCADAGCEDAQG